VKLEENKNFLLKNEFCTCEEKKLLKKGKFNWKMREKHRSKCEKCGPICALILKNSSFLCSSFKSIFFIFIPISLLMAKCVKMQEMANCEKFHPFKATNNLKIKLKLFSPILLQFFHLTSYGQQIMTNGGSSKNVVHSDKLFSSNFISLIFISANLIFHLPSKLLSIEFYLLSIERWERRRRE
jgi:hypothetical protein